MEGSIPIETVRTDGFEMDYFRFGDGEETLVILPGLSVQSVMGAADAVAAAYQPLTDAFTVYVFDRRKKPPASCTVSEMAEDTAAAFRALGLEQACVFGASQGGMMALRIAIDHPELVRRLALGSTTARMTDARYAIIDRWIALAQDGDAESLYLSFGEAVYPEEVFEQSRELLVDAARTVTDAELARFVVLAAGMRSFDVTDALDGISCPVLVIGSRDDRVLGADASEQLAAALRGHTDCELYMYDGYGHAAYDTAPDYRDRLLRFFAPETGAEQ